MDIKNILRDRLLTLRELHNLTQAEVAEGAGIALRAYQNYERALREAPVSAVMSLADFYDISLDELMGRERPKR